MDNEMNIQSAQYIRYLDEETPSSISVVLVDSDRTLSVPLVEGNRHYDEIMRQVNAGTLTIQEAV